MIISLGGQGSPLVLVPSAPQRQENSYSLSPNSKHLLFALSPHIFGRSHIPKKNFCLKKSNITNK